MMEVFFQGLQNVFIAVNVLKNWKVLLDFICLIIFKFQISFGFLCYVEIYALLYSVLSFDKELLFLKMKNTMGEKTVKIRS